MSTPQGRPSRYGERLVTRRLAARHADRLGLLATLLGRTPVEAQQLARQAVVLARREGGAFEEALTRAFSRLSVTLPHAADARARLVLLLVDVERRRPEEAARLLGLAPEELAQELASARRALPERPCRGWGLVSRRPSLTEAERAAGAAHAEICRRCRERLAAVERVRAQVLGGSAGVVSAVAGAQLLPWGAGAAGSLVTGKVTAGVIGAVGAAVLATGGAAVAVDQTRTHHPRPAPAVPAAASPAPEPRPHASTAEPQGPAAPTPGPTHVPLPLPSAAPTGVPDVPVPTLPEPQLPVVPLPSLPAVPQHPGPLLTPLQQLLDGL